jgi:hypothetical protein
MRQPFINKKPLSFQTFEPVLLWKSEVLVISVNFLSMVFSLAGFGTTSK